MNIVSFLWRHHDAELSILIKGLLPFLYSIWWKYVKVGSLMAKKKLAWHCFLLFLKNVKPLPGDTQANSQPRWWMRERLPLPWKLARSLLSKQMRVSWCGLSFPPSWRCYSTKVWGLWEKPVWARGEEMCIYLCWWGTTSTLICLQSSVRISLQAAEAVRSLSQPREVREDGSAQVSCSRCSRNKASQFVDINYSMNSRRIAPNSKLFIQIGYQSSTGITRLNVSIWRDRCWSALMKPEDEFMGEICLRRMWYHGVWSPTIHLPNLNHWANNLLFVLFFPPRMEWLIKWSFFHCLEKGKRN